MRRNPKRILAIFFCVSICGALAGGQSGRKQKKTDPQPPVQGINRPDARVQSEPEVAPEKEKEKEPKRGIMVMSGMTDIAIPLYYADTARQGCLSELRELVKMIDLREDRNQNRSDAIKFAKNDDRTHVVLIELEYDRMGVSNTGVELRYTIFEPKTGKPVGSGMGYPTQPSGRVGMPPIGGSRDQIYLDWSGRDIARQVVKRLGLGGY